LAGSERRKLTTVKAEPPGAAYIPESARRGGQNKSKFRPQKFL
jgi:hypothetical protein